MSLSERVDTVFLEVMHEVTAAMSHASQTGSRQRDPALFPRSF
jgi:hypothetical protein